jgi:hypothetical protein
MNYYILARPLPLEPAYGRNEAPDISDPVWVTASRRVMIPGKVHDVVDNTVVVVVLDNGLSYRFNKKEIYPRDPSQHD